MEKDGQKKNPIKAAFDVPQGPFDGAEVSELVGVFILRKINRIVHTGNHDLYRDDGLIAVPDKRGNDVIRKRHFKLFEDLNFEM